MTACTPDGAPGGYDVMTNIDQSSSGGSASGGSSTGGSAMGGSSNAGTPPDSKRDLSGRWLVVQRSVEEGLGVQQAVRNWMYFEFSQSGPNVTTTRGLLATTLAPKGDAKPF